MRYKRHRKQASLNGFGLTVVPCQSWHWHCTVCPRAAGHKNGGGELRRGCLSSHKWEHIQAPRAYLDARLNWDPQDSLGAFLLRKLKPQQARLAGTGAKEEPQLLPVMLPKATRERENGLLSLVNRGTFGASIGWPSSLERSFPTAQSRAE